MKLNRKWISLPGCG